MALGKNLFLQFAPMASWITQKKTVSKSIKKWRNQYNSVSCLFTFCLLLKIPNTLMETTLGIYGTMPSLVPIGTLCMETSPDCSTELKRSSSFWVFCPQLQDFHPRPSRKSFGIFTRIFTPDSFFAFRNCIFILITDRGSHDARRLSQGKKS